MNENTLQIINLKIKELTYLKDSFKVKVKKENRTAIQTAKEEIKTILEDL